MVRFIKPILFGYKTQSLMVVLTLYTGFDTLFHYHPDYFTTCKGNNQLYSLLKVENEFLVPLVQTKGMVPCTKLG